MERGKKKRIERALLCFVFHTLELSTTAVAAALRATPTDHRAFDPSVQQTVHERICCRIWRSGVRRTLASGWWA
jgi:hypothetical protein